MNDLLAGDPSAPRARAGRAQGMTAAATAVGIAVTVAVSALPPVRFAYHNPSLHIVLDTAEAAIGLLVAYLLFGRFRQSRLMTDLLLVCALMVLGLTNLFLAAVPATVVGRGGAAFTTWIPLVARVLGAATIATAAVLPTRRMARPWSGGRVVGACLLSLAAVAAVVWATFGSLPVGVAVEIDPARARTPLIAGHPVLLALQAVSFAFYAAAAWSFTRRATDTGDDLMAWLGAASALGAFARVNYFLFPSLYSEFVYTGDFLRLGFYLLLLGGAAREIGNYWRTMAQTAVFDERRRMARELHDGLTQELAFIYMQTRRKPDGTNAAAIGEAAERALGEARRGIAALTRPVDEPLDVALAQTVEEVAMRAGTNIRLDLSPGIEVAPEIRENLLRIAREAVINAARHSGAQTVTVTLERAAGLDLRIADDGEGLDIEGVGRGFGLTTMSERAKLIGADLSIRAIDGGGTQVEVVLP